MARNPQLSKFFVRDLNADPDNWALADESFDAVTCCVSVQYYQQPERVFAEVLRVLKPGGVAIFSFSTRMFSTKAIASWRDGTSFSRVQQVKSYFQSVWLHAAYFVPRKRMAERELTAVSQVRGFTPPELVNAVAVAEDKSLFGMLRCALRCACVLAVQCGMRCALHSLLHTLWRVSPLVP